MIFAHYFSLIASVAFYIQSQHYTKELAEYKGENSQIRSYAAAFLSMFDWGSKKVSLPIDDSLLSSLAYDFGSEDRLYYLQLNDDTYQDVDTCPSIYCKGKRVVNIFLYNYTSMYHIAISLLAMEICLLFAMLLSQFLAVRRFNGVESFIVRLVNFVRRQFSKVASLFRRSKQPEKVICHIDNMPDDSLNMSLDLGTREHATSTPRSDATYANRRLVVSPQKFTGYLRDKYLELDRLGISVNKEGYLCENSDQASRNNTGIFEKSCLEQTKPTWRRNLTF